MAQRNTNIEAYPTRSDWDDIRHRNVRSRDHFSAPPSNKEKWEHEGGYDDIGIHHGVDQHFRGIGPKNYKRSDDRIYEDVCEALMAHPRVDPLEIEVSVDEGVVTLEGTVSSREMKRMAEDAALDCLGVVDVQNHLYIASRYQNSGMLEARWQEEKKLARSQKRKSH